MTEKVQWACLWAMLFIGTGLFMYLVLIALPQFMLRVLDIYIERGLI